MRAVAFIIFDRPELTKRLFEKMRSAKSAILLVQYLWKSAKASRRKGH